MDTDNEANKDDDDQEQGEEQLFLYKTDPDGTDPVIEYEHSVLKVKSKVDRNLPDVKKYLEEEPDAADDEIRWEVTDPSYYDLKLPQDTVCVVEFYAPWCPHCVKYKPEYIQLAKDVQHRNTGQVPVQFYALSCVAHSALCDAYEIDGFPTVFGFPLIGTGTDEDADPAADSSDKYHESPISLNPHDLPDMTPDIIADNLGISITRVTPLDNSDSQQQNFTAEEQLEWDAKLESFAEDAVDRIQSRMEYPKHLAETYMDAALSLVFALEQGVRYQHQAGGAGSKHKSLGDEHVATLNRFLDVLLWTVPPSWGFYNVIQEVQLEMSTIRLGRSRLKEVLHRHDSFSWGIVGHSHQAFEHVLPIKFSSANPRSLTTSWSEGCTHGNAGAGFTCGLWQLFHIVTIGAAEQHEASLSSGHHHDQQSFSTLAVADTIKDFVESFFGCAVCRDNFVSAYNGCAYKVCQRLTSDYIPATLSEARELPLWLWEMHNAVNTRLVQEESIETEWRNASKVELDLAVFPNPRMCPQCRGRPPNDKLRILLEEKSTDHLGPFDHVEKATDPQWDTDEVFTFLRNYYWPEGEDVYPLLLSLNPPPEDEDASGPLLSMPIRIPWFVGLPGCVILAFLARRLIKSLHLQKSGSHKKYDDIVKV